jgi:hypothetical protein
MHRPRIFRFDSNGLDSPLRLLSDCVSLAEGQRESWETITRVVKFDDPYYGEVEITRAMLNRMVKNFEADVYGQQIAVDIAHMASNGAAGFVRELSVESGKLRGRIEWTELGVDAVTKKGYRYFSAEFHDNYKDPETGKQHGHTLLGAGLTTRPRVKRLDPVDPQRLQLSFDGVTGDPPAVSPRIITILREETKTMKNKFIKLFTEAVNKLEALGDELVKQFTEQFSAAIEGIEDEAAAKILLDSFSANASAVAKQLSEHNTGGTITLDFTGIRQAAEGLKGGLSADDVRKLLEEERQEQATKLAEQEAKRAANRKIFADAIACQEGFDDDLKKTLSEGIDDLITASMSDDQVRGLAAHQIALGNKMSADRKLASMGYQVPGAAGNVHISIDTSGDASKLQEQLNDGLRRTSHAANGRLRLAKDDAPFVAMVLGEFDRLNAQRIHGEVKMLAGGETGISDTNLPVGFQRTVIREALSDLRVLDLVQTLTDPAAQGTTQIPYEQRDTSDVQNDGVVYEGNAIHRANVSQEMDLAYVLPMKLAFLISNEVMHFTRSSAINWDAYARNVESNARVMRELIVRRICNELQRASDAYGAVAVTGEAFDAQLTGSNSIIKTTNYPIVRPHQQKDMKGTNVGSEENAIAVVLNGTPLSAYDGTGTQAAGTYYRVTNYNLGYVQLVDESGTPVTPTDTGTNTIGYSRATNILKVDTDLGSLKLEERMNDVLRGIGARKAMLSADRFIMPDFLLMSPVLNDQATNADMFAASLKRNGTDTSSAGDLEMIKNVPSWGTNAPGVDLGDERILMGQRGTLTYTVAKPFMTGQPFEAVDSNGKAIGKKQAYGEEYSAIKVPTPIRNRLTSVIAYSYSGR